MAVQEGRRHVAGRWDGFYTGPSLFFWGFDPGGQGWKYAMDPDYGGEVRGSLVTWRTTFSRPEMLSIEHAQKRRAYISGAEFGLFVEGNWQEPLFDSGQRDSPGSTGWYS